MTPRRRSAFTSLDLLLVAVLVLAQLAAFHSAGLPAAHGASTVPSGLADYTRWFGSQHSHTGMDADDGAYASTAAQAFAYASKLPHLQYFMVTPHVHQGRAATSLFGDDTYDAIRAGAAAATTASFAAIAGQEISTIPSGGHWNLYNAQALIGEDHTDGDWDDADDYYDHVAGLGAAGEDVAAQFNHPTTGDFGDRYDPAADPYFGTFAVSSGYTDASDEDFSNNGSDLEYNTGNPLEDLWAHYLNLGWKVSPAADQDNHQATWGASSSEYTVVVRAKGTPLTPASVLEGLREHMTYATEDANMQIGFLANGWSMGQTIGGPADVAFTIWWNNPSETIRNDNTGVAVTEPPDDAIQNIWIYQDSFGTTGDSVGANAGDYVAHLQPNSVSGTWQLTLPAAAGDWFVVKFQDTYTFATDPTYGRAVSKDLTWSAPVWYDPAHADAPLLAGGAPTAAPSSPTASATPESTSEEAARPTPTATPRPTSTPRPILRTPTAPPPSAGPAISYVQVPRIGASDALITWRTNVEATTQVEYGPTTGYGSLTPLDGALSTAHQVTLSELAPGQVYHYRVRSTNAAGVESVSDDHAFKTLKK